MVYILTHNDLDGTACAILFEKIYTEVETYAIDHRELDEVLPKVLALSAGNQVYITDLSLTEEQAALCNEHGRVQHIDHHNTSRRVSDIYEWSFTDPSHCAAYHLWSMFSVYTHIEDYREFVELVDDFDTWGHGKQPSQGAKDLNRLLTCIGPETFVSRFKASPNAALTAPEVAVVATDKFNEEQYLNFVLSKVELLKDPDGNMFVIVAAEQYTSSLGNFLLDNIPDAEYSLILDMLRGQASLRSRGKVDVGEIARTCGGGGHRKSAGFNMDNTAIRSFWRCNNCESNNYKEEVPENVDESLPENHR